MNTLSYDMYKTRLTEALELLAKQEMFDFYLPSTIANAKIDAFSQYARETISSLNLTKSNNINSRFTLATDLAENWIPYFSRIVNNNDWYDRRSTVLQRGHILRNTNPLDSIDIPVSTNILKDSQFINEETIGRIGIEVNKNWQHVRGLDGETYVWLGNSVRPGLGEGESGYMNDQIED